MSRLPTGQEIFEGAGFAAAALVLPLLPNRAVDSWGVVNPAVLGQTLVVLMGFSLAGYWAVRLLGARFGLVMAGFAAGFVSSSIGIAAMGARAREEPALSQSASAGAIASILGSMMYLTALVATADAQLISRLGVALGGAVLLPFCYMAFLLWQSRTSAPAEERAEGAYHFRTIALFVTLVVAFGFISALLVAHFGEEGVLAGAVVTGLLDAHATAVSVAGMVMAGKVDEAGGGFAILVGLSANMAVKMPAAFALGPRAFGGRVSAALLLLLAGLWGGHFLQGGL